MKALVILVNAVTLAAVGGDIATSAVVTRPPAVGPHDLATSQAARQEALVAVRSKSVESIQPVDTTRTPRRSNVLRSSSNKSSCAAPDG